jgi:hypothetical protein
VNNQTRPIRRFDWSNLIPQDTGAFAPYQITQERYGFWNEITQYAKEYRPHISQILQQFNRVDLDKLKPRELIDLTAEELTKTGSSVDQASQMIQAIRDTFATANHNVTSRFIQNDPVNRQRLINLFQSNTDIPLGTSKEIIIPNLVLTHRKYPQTICQDPTNYRAHRVQ